MALVGASVLVFALAFRTNYFRIWDFDLDTDRGFAAIVEYGKQHKLESAGCTWRYAGAYNFYRLATHADNVVPSCDFIDQDNPPPRAAYFMMKPFQDEFIAKARLRIIYQGPVSGLVVGIAPE